MKVDHENYRKIEITLPGPLPPSYIEAMNALSIKYSHNDIFIEYAKNKIAAYLRELDLASFKKDIQQMTEKLHSFNGNNPFLQLVRKIESIGSYGTKSGKRIFVGYDAERKVKDRKQKEKTRQPFFYALHNRFSKKNNEVPQEFINEIICNDSETILKKLPNNCIDLILTSPPYNFGLDYEASDDGIKWKWYFQKLFKIFGECIRVLKYGGRIAVNIQPLYSDYIPCHHIISKFFMDKRLIWKGEITWEKNNYNCKYTAWGSWKSPSNPYLKYTQEYIEIFAKGSLRKEGSRENIDITAEQFKKWVIAKWSIAPERNMKKYGHPAMFPEELARRVICLFSYKGDIVLDPFNGVGTTTVVAKKLGRRYLGMDISKEYCKKAIERIQEFFI